MRAAEDSTAARCNAFRTTNTIIARIEKINSRTNPPKKIFTFVNGVGNPAPDGAQARRRMAD